MVYNIKAARRWGVSGTLHLKSAIQSRTPFSTYFMEGPRAARNVDSKVLCNASP